MRRSSGSGSAAAGSGGASAAGVDARLLDALKDWRRQRSRADGVPAYVVFHDATLTEIARLTPRSMVELKRISGIGPTKLDRYGDDVLAVIAGQA